MWIFGQALAHLGVVACLAVGQFFEPFRRNGDRMGSQAVTQRRQHRANVADERRRDRLVAVELRRRDIDLHELRIGGPLRRVAMTE